MQNIGGGAKYIMAPNQIIGGAMAPLPLPPYRAPTLGCASVFIVFKVLLFYLFIFFIMFYSFCVIMYIV